MKTITPSNPSPYVAAVDRLLMQRHGVRVGCIRAESAVAAAERAGYSPQECVAWLAEVDDLESMRGVDSDSASQAW